MYNCLVPWYRPTVVDETSVDEMSVDEVSVDELSWNRCEGWLLQTAVMVRAFLWGCGYHLKHERSCLLLFNPYTLLSYVVIALWLNGFNGNGIHLVVFDPLPLERDVLYGRPLRCRKEKEKQSAAVYIRGWCV